MFNDDIFNASNRKKECLICRRHCENEILIKHFKASKNENKERMKTIEEAARIIIEDIESI